MISASHCERKERNMFKPQPRRYEAGPREADVSCPHCRMDVTLGAPVAVCPKCGTAHHAACWDLSDGCGSYDCAPASRKSPARSEEVLRITSDEIDRARPLQRPAPFSSAATVGSPHDVYRSERSGPKRLQWLALVSLVTGLVGIPLFGFITGLVAVLLGFVALLVRKPYHRGLWMACLAIPLGIADFVGWAYFYSAEFMPGAAHAHIQNELEVEPESLKDLPPEILRAMKANVLIQTGRWPSTSIGSGVILKIEDRSALILTNRHVIDPKYSGKTDDTIPTSNVTVKMLGQSETPGAVEWVAPNGIDLALVRVFVTGHDAEAAQWDPDAKVVIGRRVFAVGNPHGLGWTHTAGDVSQIRRQEHGLHIVPLIQTTAAINPGNSGGGLYDDHGNLIGINSLTHDKRMAEGLGFAISFRAFLDFVPASFNLKTKADAPRQP